MTGIVFIGGGQAAASSSARLRQKGYDGPITILCAEPVAPYQRPPLSKAYLLGKSEVDRLLVRPVHSYEKLGITLRLGVRAETINASERRVGLGDGTIIGYTDLVLATGARPNRLPAPIGGDLRGVHTIRTLADIDAIRYDLAPRKRLVVIGGGYIGLEVAAVAVQMGLLVTVLEVAPRVLARVASAETADLVTAIHRKNGCRIMTDVQVQRISQANGRVSAVHLSDGTELPCDLVVAGIGVRPETQLAEAAGLSVDNGIRVDDLGRTSHAGIWAIGDCASFPVESGRLRLESVGHAIAHGECIADNILGAGRPYIAEPWFWSDQYDTKLQIAGLSAPGDRVVTRLTSEMVISLWYFRNDRLVAVDAVNDPRSHMIARRLLASRGAVDEAMIADPHQDLRQALDLDMTMSTKSN